MLTKRKRPARRFWTSQDKASYWAELNKHRRLLEVARREAWRNK